VLFELSAARLGTAACQM